MRTGKFSPWLWLALILSIPIMAWPLWQAAHQISILLPYRSVTDWASDPIWVLSAAFDCLGFIGIVMALWGDRRALLFWNLCHLALLFAFRIERPILMGASVLATIAAFMANRRIRNGAASLHTANSS